MKKHRPLIPFICIVFPTQSVTYISVDVVWSRHSPSIIVFRMSCGAMRKCCILKKVGVIVIIPSLFRCVHCILMKVRMVISLRSIPKSLFFRFRFFTHTHTHTLFLHARALMNPHNRNSWWYRFGGGVLSNKANADFLGLYSRRQMEEW